MHQRFKQQRQQQQGPPANGQGRLLNRPRMDNGKEDSLPQDIAPVPQEVPVNQSRFPAIDAPIPGRHGFGQLEPRLPTLPPPEKSMSYLERANHRPGHFLPEINKEGMIIKSKVKVLPDIVPVDNNTAAHLLPKPLKLPALVPHQLVHPADHSGGSTISHTFEHSHKLQQYTLADEHAATRHRHIVQEGRAFKSDLRLPTLAAAQPVHLLHQTPTSQCEGPESPISQVPFGHTTHHLAPCNAMKHGLVPPLDLHASKSNSSTSDAFTFRGVHLDLPSPVLPAQSDHILHMGSRIITEPTTSTTPKPPIMPQPPSGVKPKKRSRPGRKLKQLLDVNDLPEART